MYLIIIPNSNGILLYVWIIATSSECYNVCGIKYFYNSDTFSKN